jgi:hypothetical protein
MRQWLRRQLGPLLDDLDSGTAVILDPDGFLDAEVIEELGRLVTVHCVEEWPTLRILWDSEIRARDDQKRSIALVVRSSEFATTSDLPWDIEREASSVIKLHAPVPLELRELFAAAPMMGDELAEAAMANTTTEAIVAKALSFRVGEPSSELDLIARLRSDPSTPPELWVVLAQILQTGLASQIASQGGDLASLQMAWQDWLQNGESSASAETLQAAPGAILMLIASGLLAPSSAAAANLPAWVTLGSAEPDVTEVLAELVAQMPKPASNLTEWIEVATWWGNLRALASIATPQQGADAWELWDGINESFSIWLQQSYGSSLQSSAASPRAVHQIAPFLARRVEEGHKVVLLIIDGLGFSQWSRLRTVAGLHVQHSTGCLAMAPTLTSVSRQAILAGALPIDFADSLTTTSTEPRRWREFWMAQGLNARDVTYAKTLGATVDQVPEITGKVAAVVVNAVDEILHGAEVLGDPQVTASVDLWARSGFVNKIVQEASDRGFEVWITADHGNIPTIAGPVPKEGQTVETAGTRVRLYPNIVLRQQAEDYGISWDPPGLPKGTLNPLFASGRRGFHTSGVRVSHGGLSLDEMIVPFVQVTP